MDGVRVQPNDSRHVDGLCDPIQCNAMAGSQAIGIAVVVVMMMMMAMAMAMAMVRMM